MNELVEKLKFCMAENDLTIKDVAIYTKRDPLTIWQFLHQRVKPHDKTIYKIKKLLMELGGEDGNKNSES